MIVLQKKLWELALKMLCCGRKKGRLEQMSKSGARPATLKDKQKSSPREESKQAASGGSSPRPDTKEAGDTKPTSPTDNSVQKPDTPLRIKENCSESKESPQVKRSTIKEGKVHKDISKQAAVTSPSSVPRKLRGKVPASDSPRASPQRLGSHVTHSQHKQQHPHHPRVHHHLQQQQQQQQPQSQQPPCQLQYRQHNRRGDHVGHKTNASSTLEMGIKNMEQVDEDTMIQTVEILKRPGQSLGFYIREGNGLDRSDGVFISRIATGSVVENNGLLRIGDEIMTVNSVDVSKMSLDDVVILMSIPKRLVLTVRTRKACCKNASCPSLSTLEQEEEPPPVVVVKKGRSSSATAVEMTEKCPDEVTMDERAFYAKYGQMPYPQHYPGGARVRGYGETEESPYARINDLQPYLQHHSGARDQADPSPQYDQHYMPDYVRDRRSPKMGINKDLSPASMNYHSPRVVRRAPYHVDYSSDTDTRHLHDRGLQESPYSAPRLPPRTYDPQAVKAFQEEIERSHHRYESMSTPRSRFVKSQRSLSPERYNSDSEIMSVYGRGRDPHMERVPAGSKEHYLAQLSDSGDDRCNSLPHMEARESSEELKHWLRKFDNLSMELQQGQGTSPQEPPRSQPGPHGPDTSPYTPRPGLTMAPGPQQGIPMSGPMTGPMHTSTSDRDSYTSEEYWTWAQKHTSPPSTMPRPQETTFPRTNKGPRPRVTRKLSADSLMDYRTYQLEDTTDQDHRNPGPRRNAPRPPSSQSHSGTYGGPGGGGAHPLVKTRQVSMDNENRIPQSPSTRMRDLQLGRKPIQVRPDDFRLYQPEMEERRPKIDQHIEGILRVHLFCGHGLKSSRTMLRDLYTVIEVDSHNKARTMIRTGAINFDWDEAFDIELENAQEMSFLVYSWDPNTRHRLCFSGTVDLPNLLNYGSNQKIALKLEPKGILYLELEYHEPAISLQRTPTNRKSSMFGVDLDTVIRHEKSGLSVPVLIKKCVEEVEKRGLDHVGIYRLCGSAKRKAQLKEEFDKNSKSVDLSAEGVSDINVVTGVLKDFLRELPEPLFTNALFQMLLDALSVRMPGDPDGSAKLMLSILECLPKPNQETLACILDHLKHVSLKYDVNKMSTEALAVCFGPLLLSPSPQSMHDAGLALDFRRHSELLRYLLDIWPAQRAQTKDPSSNLHRSRSFKSTNRRRSNLQRSMSTGRVPTRQPIQNVCTCGDYDDNGYPLATHDRAMTSVSGSMHSVTFVDDAEYMEDGPVMRSVAQWDM